jgi:hypothetical protein
MKNESRTASLWEVIHTAGKGLPQEFFHTRDITFQARYLSHAFFAMRTCDKLIVNLFSFFATGSQHAPALREVGV